MSSQLALCVVLLPRRAAKGLHLEGRLSNFTGSPIFQSMDKFLEIAFSGFWPFVGVCILIWMSFNFLFLLWNRWLRSRNIREHGYPPPHCDADGDFKKEKDDDI